MTCRFVPGTVIERNLSPTAWYSNSRRNVNSSSREPDTATKNFDSHSLRSCNEKPSDPIRLSRLRVDCGTSVSPTFVSSGSNSNWRVPSFSALYLTTLLSPMRTASIRLRPMLRRLNPGSNDATDSSMIRHTSSTVAFGFDSSCASLAAVCGPSRFSIVRQICPASS